MEVLRLIIFVLFVFNLAYCKDIKFKDKDLKKELESMELESSFVKEVNDADDKAEKSFAADLLNTDLSKAENEIAKKSVPAICRDERQDCSILKEIKACILNPEVANKQCRLTCGTCTKLEATSEICKDVVENCDTLKPIMGCDSENMVSICPKTCGVCTECSDVLKDERCKVYKEKYGFCLKTHKFRPRMEKLCYKTCGLCRAPAPPKCQTSDLGCCWDNTTEKIDEHGSNCPPCMNEYPHTCSTFNDFCWKYGSPEPFMKRHCPKLCGFCVMACKDDETYKAYCKIWKKSGYCKMDYDIREHLCPLTCETCTP